MADKIISRREAYAQGLKHYFSGTPCKRGHIANRSVATGLCTVCPGQKHNYSSAKQAAYYQRHRDRERERSREYRKANPDKLKAIRSNVEGRRGGAEGRHTLADIRRILKAQKGKCAYCRVAVGENYHVDHIVPLSRGGTNWPRNLQILCAPCNLTKNARDPIAYAQSLGFLL